MMTEIKNELNRVNNLVETENGALGFKNAENPLNTLNFRVPSLRGGIDDETISLFKRALNENLEYTVKWLFFMRDIRGGLGERDTFVRLYKSYYVEYPTQAIATLSLISEFGRWKDVVDIAFKCNIDVLKNACFSLIETQLKKDVTNFQNGKSISLLAKWAPSINATSNARRQALELIGYLGMTNGAYRKMLSKLRGYIDVLERKTCGNQWDEIDYNTVCSNANLRYSDAFMKHDEVRRRAYLEDLKNPTSGTKMNASVLYPHEIWNKYKNKNGFYRSISSTDDALEAMWNNLKEIGECGNTMVVVDGSGSMTCNVPNSNVQAIDISRSLGVYFAERCSGEFHNKMIEFSSRPKFIDIDKCETLRDKINHVSNYNDCSNTDIEAVFDIILTAAKKHNIPQDDMPARILIISDMEFDCATTHYCGWGHTNRFDYKTLFETISAKYEAEGYILPRLVFWNVNSRTNTIPVTENEAGVALISGYSVNLVKMVMSNKTDPWEILKETLDSDRYKVVGDVLKEIENV